MATFEEYVKPETRRYRRIKAGYQNMYNDRGNWTGGEIGVGNQAGTNMSISAPVLSDWRGYEVTASDMQNLTEKEALDIYYNKYWLPIKGDSIKSQTIANFLADMKSSAGGNGVKQLQEALNNLGENVSVDGSVGNNTVEAINRQNTAKLNNEFRNEMIAYYNSIGGGTNSQFLKVWLNSLDKDYPEMSVTADKMGLPEWLNNKWWIVAASVTAAIIIVIIIAYKLKK